MRLSMKMGETTKQVRVDNWGIFFLQRLQMFFSKTDFCDMTLQFEGNVQLKVHRLVMNACTEYFQFLEQTCSTEDNVILMPADLQADVIVPIVNFMYTGMLEFHLSIFDRLYKTAQIMNITILTKLLDAQKHPSGGIKPAKKRQIDSPHSFSTPVKKTPTKSQVELPATLPGRKLPVWKRKSAPSNPQTHSVSQLCFPEPKWNQPPDPLSVPDNAPKPTRFEWPDDDFPTLNLMDSSFEDISYTSKPLLTLEEEHRAGPSFDDLRHNISVHKSAGSSKKRSSSPTIDMEEMKDYVKEQKIRSGLSRDVEMDNDVDSDDLIRVGHKRKLELKSTNKSSSSSTKKVRFDETDGKSTTISIATDGKHSELDHNKIVSEILKKYPQLVKKNKNIRLKIMAKNKSMDQVQIRTSPKIRSHVTEIKQTYGKVESNEQKLNEEKTPWICERCSTEDDPVEFVLYYLYRKHMTDVHNEKFDARLCKYCGQRCNKHNLLMYHLYTKHGVKPQPSYNFPKCDQCPYIALSNNILNRHKVRHDKNEIQCVECKLAFTSQTTLTSHMLITGHTGKSSKNNYDCQYCTKRFQSGVNLFSHVRLQHRNEAIRDGIVSIDEEDEIDESDDEESEDNSKDEYILPEIITDNDVSKKVNILSNVKVQDRHDHLRSGNLTLEPSSEAEALNNVATGIATSLGLVDIVVLNDNQQLFLQSNEQNFVATNDDDNNDDNSQSNQPEFILPELTGRDSYNQDQSEVITQSMLSSGEIGSTDELVMVLTDHDYGDNQEEMNSENSNIVVLYSHPVDGQQDQFITSDGNIMVNSQTGLIEIRNGATITSTSNQVVVNNPNDDDTHIESIEMIQREIESHVDMKNEETSLYDDERKVDLAEKDELPATSTVLTNEAALPACQNDPIIESLVQGQQLEFATETGVDQTAEETTAPEENNEAVEESTEEAEPKNTEDAVIQEEEQQHEIENKSEDLCENNDEIISEVPPLAEDPVPEVPPETLTEEPSIETEDEKPVDEEVDEKPVDEEVSETANNDGVDEAVEVDDKTEEPEATVEEAVEKEADVEEAKPEEDSPKESSVVGDADVVEHGEKLAVDDDNEEKAQEVELSQSDTSNSQYNDENSQSSQENSQVATKKSILDDWEDTDSQQSDHRGEVEDEEDAKAVGETVNKLMDDWEEEDEEDKREVIE